MKKWLYLAVSLGILVRVILSMSTYHQDLGAIALSGKYIVGDGQYLKFYEYSGKDVSQTIFNYQPLAYLIPSIFYLPFGSLVKQFGELLVNNSWVSSLPNYFAPILFLFKLPMITADLLILYLLPRFFKRERSKYLAQIIWSLNPISIFVSSVMGQVDIIIALLILASYYHLTQKRFLTSAFVLAISALIKPIGLILLPVISIYYFWDKRGFVAPVVVGIGTYLLGILPYLGLVSYRHYALFADQIGKSTYAGISIASGTFIPWFFIFYLLTLYLFWSKKISLVNTIQAVLLTSLAFTHFHPQWLVWISPLLIINSLKSKQIYLYFVTLLAWVFILLSFDDTLNSMVFLHSKLSLNWLRQSTPFTLIVQASRASLVVYLFTLLIHEKKTRI